MPDTLNEICPWSGNPVAEGIFCTVNGRKIGFCSAMHCEAFASAISFFDLLTGRGGGGDLRLTSGFAEETAAFDGPKAATGKALNTRCPITGKGANAAYSTVYNGETVAFCCGDCLAKFETAMGFAKAA